MMEDYPKQNTIPESTPWNIGDIVKGTLVAIAIVIALGILLGIVMIALVGTTALDDIDLSSSQMLQEMVDILQDNGRFNIALIFMFVFMILGEAAMPLGAWLFSVRKYRCKWDSLGFRKFDVKKGLLLAAIVTAIGVGISWGYEELLEKLGWGTSSDMYLPFDASGVGMWFLAITAIVAAPLAEETFFRGFLFQGLTTRLRFQWAAIISAAIFAVMHLSPSGFVPIFILGLMLVWLFNKTQSIWPCIIVHAAYNSIAVIIMITS